ncbi:MAG: L,D-transpeptidase/peptidoglycan binding protein [Candidatus Kerfeldbacteria bacterium]|nr:L,D-transpeptidase/peptidoglycan binding protein [Candidatus Kerfeldbacteria bacterium]
MSTHALPRTFVGIPRHLLSGGAIIVGSIGMVLLFGFVSYASLNSDNFYRNTVLGSVDIGGTNYAEARTEVAAAIADYEKNISLHDSTNVYRPSFHDLGVTIDLDHSLRRAWEVGHAGSVTTRVADMTNSVVSAENLPLVFEVDTDVMYETMFQMAEELNVPMKNAAIEIAEGRARVIHPQTGRRVDIVSLEQAIRDSISYLRPIEVEVPFVETPPVIFTEDLAVPLQRTNVALSRAITMTHDSHSYEATPPMIGEWMSYSEIPHPTNRERKTLELGLNEEAVMRYFDSIAGDVEAEGKTRKVIPAVYRDELESGEPTLLIATQQNIEALEKILLSQDSRTMEIVTEHQLPHEEILTPPAPPTREGKAISVDIAKQIAYAWLDGELQYFAKVSSGKGGHKTPTGSFKVYNKSRDQKMSGADFYLPHIPYILWYNGDYSLHGTYWHNNFGTPMSHGCSNLSILDAKWFFEFAEIGTPVIIFES